MERWQDRPLEERHLLNPAFCATVLWHAAKGATDQSNSSRYLTFMEAFLILPLVLHERTRDVLPIRISSSLPVWVSSQPLLISTLPMKCKSLTPYTKEAILYGGANGVLQLGGPSLLAEASCARSISKTMRSSTAEVQECMKKAQFLGKWFSHTSDPITILTLFGVRP